jgi:hypothetical protein
MQDGGGMLQLAGLADDGGLAVAVGLAGLDAQRLHAALAEQRAQFLADGDQFVEAVAVAAGVRVVDDRHGQRLAGGRRDGAAHLGADLVDLDDDLADLAGHGCFPSVGGRAISAARPIC